MDETPNLATLSIHEAAKATGIPESTMRAMCARGEIASIIPNGRLAGRRIRVTTLDEWMAERENESLAGKA